MNTSTALANITSRSRDLKSALEQIQREAEFQLTKLEQGHRVNGRAFTGDSELLATITAELEVWSQVALSSGATAEQINEAYTL